MHKGWESQRAPPLRGSGASTKLCMALNSTTGATVRNLIYILSPSHTCSIAKADFTNNTKQKEGKWLNDTCEERLTVYHIRLLNSRITLCNNSLEPKSLESPAS